MTLELPSNKNFAKVSVTRGSQELSKKERRTRINELLFFIPSAVLKLLTTKQLENKLVAHRCAICEKVFRLTKGVKAHKEDAHGIATPVTKRRPKHRILREKPVSSYNEDFYCDYECGFSTEDIVTMSYHIKSHHAERATRKIKHLKKHRDENGNIDLPCQQGLSDLDFTDETIPEPTVIKSQVSCIQEAGNKTEEIIFISDDEEEVATPKTTETGGNGREFMSSGVCSTTPKATNVSYEDSVHKEQGYLFSTGRQLDDEASSNVGRGLDDFQDELGAEESESEYSSDDEESDSADDLSDEHVEECDFEDMSDKEEDKEFDTVFEISDTEENNKFCIDATNDKSEDLDSDKDDIMECYMLVNGMLYEIAD